MTIEKVKTAPDDATLQNAPQDAEVAEWILKAFCDHLLEDP